MTSLYPCRYTRRMSKGSHRRLAAIVSAGDVTIRAFVLMALMEKGLSVSDEDLLDRRNVSIDIETFNRAHRVLSDY